MYAERQCINIGPMGCISNPPVLTINPFQVDHMATHRHTIVMPEDKSLDLIEWRPIARCSLYLVSEYGHVRRADTGRLMAPSPRPPKGYLFYTLSSPGNKPARVYAHRCVAEAFIGTAPTERHVVAHSDGDHLHNHANNLRWATQKENLADRVFHGTDPCGSRNPNACLPDAAVVEIKRRYKRGNGRALALEYGVEPSSISKIIRGKTWKHI